MGKKKKTDPGPFLVPIPPCDLIAKAKAWAIRCGMKGALSVTAPQHGVGCWIVAVSELERPFRVATARFDYFGVETMWEMF